MKVLRIIFADQLSLSNLALNNLNKDDLVKFLSDKLAAFKIPALIKFMDSNLPLVASGKFDKPALREIFTQE